MTEYRYYMDRKNYEIALHGLAVTDDFNYSISWEDDKHVNSFGYMILTCYARDLFWLGLLIGLSQARHGATTRSAINIK